MTAEPFNDIIAGELEKPNKVIATLGFNTAVYPAQNVQNNQNPQKLHNKKPYNNRRFNTNNAARGGVDSFYCLLCNAKQGNTHKTWQCPVYNTATLTRERMRVMSRCQRCAVPINEHGLECSHRAVCRKHPGQKHSFWLCDDFVNHTVNNQQPHQQGASRPPPQQQYQNPPVHHFSYPPPQQQMFGQNRGQP